MIIHNPAVSGSLTFANGASLTSHTSNITGSFKGDFSATNGIFSSSEQVNADTIQQFDSNVEDVIYDLGLVSESAQINANSITNFDSNVKTKLTTEGVISGSSQLTTTFDTRYVNSTGNETISGNKTFNNNVVITGDLDVAGTTNFTSTNQVNIGDNVLNLNYGGGATDGGIYVTDVTAGGLSTGSLLWSGINDRWVAGTQTNEVNVLLSDGDGIVSQSAQISFNSISDKPNGIVSGSSQITDGSGIISESQQLHTDFDSRYLNTNSDGVISSSEQVSYTDIINKPTIPAAASNATITLNAGTDLGTGGDFTTNQSSNETITINHSNITRTDTTSTNSPEYGETFTAIDSVTTSARGHVTAVNLKTVTLPSTDDTSYDLSVQAGASNTSIIRLSGSDSTNDDVTISGGTGITIAESGNTITITGTAQYGDSDVKDKLNEETVISGSSQISLSGFSTTNLSEGTNKYYTDARVKTKLNTEGVISGSASQGRSFLNVDEAGTDNSTDVTLGNTNYLSLSGQQITGGTIPVASGGTGATDADTARTALNVDAAGTDNSTNVTIATGKDYITISGQELTLGSVDASSDISNLNTSNVSEGSNKYYTDARVKTKLNTETVISGSQQILNLVSIDEDNFTSNSNTKVPTQQSVKAYVDSKAQSQDNTDELTEGSTNLFYTDSRVKTKINAEDVVSGSASDVRSFLNVADGATNYGDTNVKTKLTSEDVVSGSASDVRTFLNVEDGATADQTALDIQSLLGTGNNALVPTTGTSGHFLKHDGTFGLPSYTTNTNTNQLTTFTVRDDDNDNFTISQGKFIKFVSTTGTAGTNITGTGTTSNPYLVTISSPDTTTNTMGTGFTVSATTDTNATTITQGDDLFFAAGTGISVETTADGTVTIANTVSNTNTNQLTTFIIRDDDNDEKEIAQDTYLKFTSTVGAAGTNFSGTGTTSDPFVLAITSPNDNDNDNTQNTYSTSVVNSSGIKLRLTGAGHDGATTDDIKFVGAGGATVSRTDASTITITTTDNNDNTQNTTTLSFVDSSDDIILRNTTGGAGSGNQDIKLVAGSNIALTHTDANNFTIASTYSYTHPNHSGDVTSTGDGQTSIGANKVTHAKYQQVATDTIIGRTASGTGNVTALTATEVRGIIGTGNDKLVPSIGTDGHFLKHDGTFGLPSYTTNTNLSTEAVQDIVGAMFSSNTETRISATYVDGGDDGTGKINLVVTDMTANDNDDVSVANLKTRLGSSFGSNAVSIGDSNDTVTIPGDLVVTGTTTTNNVTTVSTSNGVVFEGNVADAHEGTLLAGTLSADRTYTLPNKTGTVAMTSDITGTNSGTNSGDETKTRINNLGITTVGTIDTGVWQGSAIHQDYLSGQSGTNTGDETLSSINGLGITTLGTIGTGVWNGSAIHQDYLSGQSGTNTGDETKARINALDITEVGTISSGVWQGSAIADAYLSSNTAHLSGTQTFTGAKSFDEAVNINKTTASTSKTTGALIVDGGVGIAKALQVGGDVVAYASSDERYKDNVTPIENPNEKLKQIGGYTFDWNDKHEVFKGQHDVGVIAQEIEKVLPEIVETRESGYKAVKYEKIVALLIESNKELLKRIEELENKLK